MAALRDPDRLNRSAKGALLANLNQYERQALGHYAEALEAIRRDIAAIYERYSVDGSLTYAEMSRYNRLAALEKQITEDLRPVFLKDRNLIEKMSRVQYEESFYRHAWAIDQQSGVALTWGLLRESDVIASVANPLRKIAETSLKQDGIASIRRVITQGLIRGQSYPQMARGIRNVVLSTERDSIAVRAIRIVRTEGNRAMVLGQQATYEKASDMGVDVVPVWDATLDSRTRPSHGALDGVAAKYDDEGAYWDTEVGKVRGPGRSGVASFDINCRCRITGRVEGYEPTMRRVRGEGVVAYKTYDEWKAGLNQRGRSA